MCIPDIATSTLQSLMAMSLSASSLLVAASTFLMNQVFNLTKAHAPKSELKPFAALILALLTIPIILMIGMILITINSSLEPLLKGLYCLLTLAPLIPAVSITGLLVYKYRGSI